MKLTYLDDPQYQSSILEVVLQAEVDLADILRRFGVVDVHVHQGNGAVLQKRHLSAQIVHLKRLCGLAPYLSGVVDGILIKIPVFCSISWDNT